MNRVLKCIERMIQVITIIGAIWTAIEGIKLFSYKKKLKQKADEYLDDELAFEGNMRGAVSVYSPSLKLKQEQVTKLAIVTSIGAVISIVLNLINRDRY